MLQLNDCRALRTDLPAPIARHFEIRYVAHQSIATASLKNIVIENALYGFDRLMQFTLVEVAFGQVTIECREMPLRVMVTIALFVVPAFQISSDAQIVLCSIH